MNNISKSRRNISYVLKLVVFLSAFIGTFISFYSSRNSFMGGRTVFMYFTIQSNIAIAIISVIGTCIIAKGKEISNLWKVIKLVGTVAITLTGVVFGFVLAPTLGPNAWNVHNTLTHLVVPVAAVIDFFVIMPTQNVSRKAVKYVILPPLLYAIYAGIGYARGWQFAEGYNYPYFFLNWGSEAGAWGFTKGLPYMGTMWWIILLLLFLVAIGHIYIGISNLLGRKLNK